MSRIHCLMVLQEITLQYKIHPYINKSLYSQTIVHLFLWTKKQDPINDEFAFLAALRPHHLL